MWKLKSLKFIQETIYYFVLPHSTDLLSLIYLGGPTFERANLITMAPLLKPIFTPFLTARSWVVHIIDPRIHDPRSNLIVAIIISVATLVNPDGTR